MKIWDWIAASAITIVLFLFLGRGVSVSAQINPTYQDRMTAAESRCEQTKRNRKLNIDCKTVGEYRRNGNRGYPGEMLFEF